MRAVTFQAPGEVRVEDVAEPELLEPTDAIVRIQASGVCGSDLHIYHGRVKIEPGFTIGHEYVGTVTAVGDEVHEVSVGDRVLGCFQTACGHCFFCRRGLFHKCDSSRTFGHGATLGSLQGTQAEQALVPSADLVLRKVPEGMSDDVALFAGDVMGTGYHAAAESGLQELYLLCDDIQAFVEEMVAHNIICGAVETQRWGLVTHITLPGGGKLGVYEPKHARP